MTSDEAALLGEASRLRGTGRSWRYISLSLGRSYEFFRRHLDHDYRRRRNAQISALQRGERHQVVGNAHRSEPPPQHVVDELAHAAAAPRTLTASIMGDPLPGRSALDHHLNKRRPETW